MHWFHDTQHMDWLLVGWIVSSVVFVAGVWLMTLGRKGSPERLRDHKRLTTFPAHEGHHQPS